MKLFLQTYLKKPWVLVSIGIVIIIILGIIIFLRPAPSLDDFFVVKSGTVQEGVSVTGNVKSAVAVDLAFEKGGKIAVVAKDVGDTVDAGDLLVSLSNDDIRAEITQAQATVDFQQAKLTELEKGTRPEEIKISADKTESAQADLNASRSNLVAALQSGYSSTDDAIHNKTDSLFSNARTFSPQLLYATFDGSQTPVVESGRVEVESRLNRLKNDATLASSTSNLPGISTEMKQDIAEAKLFLDTLALALNNSAVPDADKANLSSARTEVNMAISTILAADANYTSALSALTNAQNQLSLDQAGNVAEEIQAQQAQVLEAQANVANFAAQLAKTYIRSPIAGVVTKQDAKVGEIAPGNTPLVSVISNAEFQIEADVAEADIAKVAVGEKASVTLDAYGPDVHFDAVVVAVDPAETIVDGVPTYKTTFQFNQADDRIKSGMTANIDIAGQMHAHVLSVPQRAIISHDGAKFVRVKTGTLINEVEVETGLRGEDGSVEITTGLHEGDTVAIKRAGS